MTFKVLINPQVIKKANKYLPKAHRRKFAEFLKALEKEPIPKGYDIKKLAGWENAYRLRLGKYRVLYFILWDERIIEVHEILPRESAYKR